MVYINKIIVLYAQEWTAILSYFKYKLKIIIKEQI